MAQEKLFDKLIAQIDRSKRVFIQTHDYPDHDAVSAAFALHILLCTRGISSTIIYAGDVQRESLHHMILYLQIPILHNSHFRLHETDQAIIIDGCKGNRNVFFLPPREVGVIDHHEVDHPEDVPYVDIRPGIGSCATLIWDYYQETETKIPQNVATALLTGIAYDTSQLTRRVSDLDLAAYTQLFRLADLAFFRANISNYLEFNDLDFFKEALQNIRYSDSFGFCFLHQGCSKNLMGIISEFFIGLRNVHVIVVCAKNNNYIHCSIRCKGKAYNASLIIAEALEGIGTGGGHAHMAGGRIKLKNSDFDPELLFDRLKRSIKQNESKEYEDLRHYGPVGPFFHNQRRANLTSNSLYSASIPIEK